MELSLTTEQAQTLLKLVYMGNWMVNAYFESGETISEYENMEQDVLEQLYAAGATDDVTYDHEIDRYQSASVTDPEGEVHQHIARYDNQLFWEELAERLADRDWHEQFPGTSHRDATPESEVVLTQLVQKYTEEFGAFGLKRLRIVE